MKHITLELTDHEHAALKGAVARGDFASEDEAVHEALALFLDAPDGPDAGQIARDIAAWREGSQKTLSPAEVMESLKASITG
ncbi:MAG: hypothetical protein ABI459_08835 [Deltaproteobacteria bacterium]